MKKILFIQSEFDFNRYLDKKIFTDTNDVEFTGIKYLNKPPEYFTKYTKIFNCNQSDKFACSIIEKANSVDIDTFLLMDGIYDWANININPIWSKNNFFLDLNIYDKVYCVDNHSSLNLNLIGIKTDLYKPPKIFEITSKKENLKNRFKKTSRKKILLTTSNTPYFNETEFKRIVKIFLSIIEWSKLNSLDIYYRIYDEKILKELKIVNEFNLKEGPIDTYLKEIDVLITTPSSISITAAMLDKPFIHIIYRDTPIAFQAAWQIFNTEMIPDVLKSALNRDKNRMIHQKSILPHLETESKKLNSKKKINKNFQYSKADLFLAIFKAKIKKLYHKLFKYR